MTHSPFVKLPLSYDDWYFQYQKHSGVLVEVQTIRFECLLKHLALDHSSCPGTVSSKIRKWAREPGREWETDGLNNKKKLAPSDCSYLQTLMEGSKQHKWCEIPLDGLKSVFSGIQKRAFLNISKGVALTGSTPAWSRLDPTEWKFNQISFERGALWTLPGRRLEKGLMTPFDRGNVCR